MPFSLPSSVESVASTASANITGIQNQISGAVGSLGTSLKGALSFGASKANGLTSVTKFSDTFSKPSRLDLAKPEESSKNRSTRLEGLTYPEDIGEYFIVFSFKEYERKVPLTSPKSLDKLFINLPVPANLQEQFNMSYADKKLGILGALGETVEGLLKGANLSEQKNVTDAFNAIKSTLSAQEAGKETARFITDPARGLAYGANVIAGAADKASGLAVSPAFQGLTGTVLNPFVSLLFQGVGLRTHSFTYKFSPNSARENAVLKKIIYEFKRRMHPEKTGAVFNFPNLIDIKFGWKDSEPYFFKTCFLESMTLNYAPSGTPAFFAMTNEPVEIDLTLNFKETDIITRSDFKEPIDQSGGI